MLFGVHLTVGTVFQDCNGMNAVREKEAKEPVSRSDGQI